jgi:hypothetical protein
MSKTHTKRNVIVEDIKIGDIHYEYEMGLGIKCEVISKPILNQDGQWEWESKNCNSGTVIGYLVDPKYSHYSANLYDYEAYNVKFYI